MESTPRQLRCVPDGLLQPGLFEAMASCIQRPADFENFLDALPSSLWSPAMAAWRELQASRHMHLRWPSITLSSVDEYSPDELRALSHVVSLQPSVCFEDAVSDVSELAAIVPCVGPGLRVLALRVDVRSLHPGDGRVLADLVRQCSALQVLALQMDRQVTGDEPELDGLLHAMVHPTVHELNVSLGYSPSPASLGHLVAQWLQLGRAKTLQLSSVATMSTQVTDALCDALQASTTLQALELEAVEGLNGFHGRRLPSSLRQLLWDDERFREDAPEDEDAPSDAELDHLAHALQHTRVESLSYQFLGELASRPSACLMLSQLTTLQLSVEGMDTDRWSALLAGLARMGSLRHLLLTNNYLGARRLRGLLTALTQCPRLESLNICHNLLDGASITALLAAVPQLPSLRELDASHGAGAWSLAHMDNFMVHLVAAGRQLRSLAISPARETTIAHAVLAPEITETIALLLPWPGAIAAFMGALPAWAKTPALAALSRLYSIPTVASVAWPSITVLRPHFSSATSEDLAAVTALCPRIHVSYAIGAHDDLAVAAGAASCITSLRFDIQDALNEATWAFFCSTISSCTRLESLDYTDRTGGHDALGGVFMDLPRLTSLSLGSRMDSGEVHLTTGFCERFVTWLQTTSVVTLKLSHVTLDVEPASALCGALCDAIATSATLTSLALNNVNLFEGAFLHGRALPMSLTSLEWDKDDMYDDNGTDEGLDNFVAALIDGPHLRHLGCKRFEELWENDEVVEKLRHLTSLEVQEVDLEVLELLTHMPDLEKLDVKGSILEYEVVHELVSVLCGCQNLRALTMKHNNLGPTDLELLLQHVPQMPRLQHLDVSEHQLTMDDILGMLAALNTAATRLETIRLHGFWGPLEIEAFANAVAHLPQRQMALVPRLPDPWNAEIKAFCTRSIHEYNLAPEAGSSQCIIYF
ncbi:hypothetical protein SPRG_02746 [Saprolegnia parasitica CBS 223.65]|uniref:Uncharacterized protein n=1 Tax=Saprolegnia parasitica (strain CBS 223.65) TaxID=695850 RepID=A0A067CZQ2_SAPPC|nr:hypothetical protein SPRG_02746 [Saprolegnia parasitica CBS 223.65]KDO32267.1 hypothetical protein SPRG_02746 [Saprolegnia parasitica CBS 223.65]|eukprot:XP_012196723.1 hypothetical protein SPRG_02746 [Saprolegnia parasitica CBS 223.65]